METPAAQNVRIGGEEDMIDKLAIVLEVARSASLRGWRIVVAAAWFTVALAALLALSETLTFTYHNSSGIHGWVSNNQYPKQQELVWFLAAVAGIPAVMLAGGALWTLAAAGLARRTGLPPSIALKSLAASHLPLLLAWHRLYHLRADAWRLLPLAAAAGLLLLVLVMLFIRARDLALGCWHSSSRPRSDLPPVADGGTPAREAPCPQQAFPRDQDPASRDVLRGGPPLPIPAQASPPTAAPPRPRWRRTIRLAMRIVLGIILFLAIPCLLYRLRLHVDGNGRVDLFHEAEFLLPMDEMTGGAVPYRDIYLQHGLFHNALIPWLGATMLEPTLSGVRTARAYIEPLGLVAFYFLVIAICRARIPAAAFMVFLCCGSIPGVPSRATFGMLSLAVLAMALAPPRGFRILAAPAADTDDDPRPKPQDAARICLRQGWPFVLSGALAMLAFWHSVEVGLYSLAAGLIFLATASVLQTGIRPWRRVLPVALYAVGAALAFTPFAAYFAVHGALDDMIGNVWIQCVHQNDTWGLAFPKFLDVFRPILLGPGRPAWPDWLIRGGIQWYYGALGLTLASAFLACRCMGEGFWRSRSAPTLLLVTLAGTCFFRTTLGRSDSSHIHYGVLFALALAVFLADRLLATAWDRFTADGARTRHRLLGLPWLAAGLVVAASLAWFCDKAYNPRPALTSRWARLREWPTPTGGTTPGVPRAGRAIIPGDQAGQLRNVSDYIRRHSRPDQGIFDFSSQAGFLFFAGRRSATRYFHACYASLPAMQEEVVRDLERQQVTMVIYRAGTWFDRIDGVPAETRHPIIAAYLNANYEPADTVGSVVFWKRRGRDHAETIRTPHVDDARGTCTTPVLTSKTLHPWPVPGVEGEAFCALAQP
jgi:hypothetical protein